MNIFFKFLIVSLMTNFLILHVVGMPTIDVHEKNDENVKSLSYQSFVNEIIKDLIAALNSPLAYLKKRGYINAPQMEFDTIFSNHMSEKKDTSAARLARFHEEETQNDLGQLFRSFSSTDDNISDKIKSKLNVPWDMNALKNLVRSESLKLYEKFYERHNGHTPKESEAKGETEIEKQVAQLYPTVVLPPCKDIVSEEEPKAVSQVKRKLSGIAKFVTCQANFLPHAPNDQKETAENISPAI